MKIYSMVVEQLKSRVHAIEPAIGKVRDTLANFIPPEVMPVAVREYVEHQRARAESRVPMGDFLAQNSDRFSGIDIGFFFAPQMFGVRRGLAPGERDKRIEEALKGLRWGINHINPSIVGIGPAWSHIIDENGKLDMSLYDPFLDELVKRGIPIDLNVGIKTKRYPESKLRDDIAKKRELLPRKWSMVRADHWIAQQARVDYEGVAAYVAKKYGSESVARVLYENEPDLEALDHRWKIDPQHRREGIERTKKYFPEAQFVVNAWGFPSWSEFGKGISGVDHARRFIEAQIADGATERYILAPDYYQRVPFPWLRIRFLEQLDQIFHAEVFGRGAISRMKESAKDGKFGTGSHEFQIGDWEKYTTTREDVQFGLQRVREGVINTTHHPATIMVWDIEGVYKKQEKDGLTEDQAQIGEIFRRINDKKAA